MFRVGEGRKIEGLRANETRSKWTRSIFSMTMRHVPMGRVPMRRVPNRRGYIVMADTFTWFITYFCIIDVFMRNERCAFWSFRPKICAYLKICVAIEGNGHANLYVE